MTRLARFFFSVNYFNSSLPFAHGRRKTLFTAFLNRIYSPRASFQFDRSMSNLATQSCRTYGLLLLTTRFRRRCRMPRIIIAKMEPPLRHIPATEGEITTRLHHGPTIFPLFETRTAVAPRDPVANSPH